MRLDDSHDLGSYVGAQGPSTLYISPVHLCISWKSISNIMTMFYLLFMGVVRFCLENMDFLFSIIARFTAQKSLDACH